MKFTAVQMIGTQRSGSNLLRLMLNQLPEVAAPHPPHILERFLPLLPAYGNLSQQQNFNALVHDVCTLVAYNPVQWQQACLKEDAIIKHCKKHSLIEIVKAIYELNAAQENASIWLCKSLVNIHYTDLLEASIQPYYIFLYRDGRDVAASFKKAVVGEKHIYNIAQQWQQEQELCLSLQKKLGKERVTGVCYENLISHPEKELKKICRFIGATYQKTCLEYYTSSSAKNTAASGKMWQNVERSIMADNFNNYRRQLSKDEIILFERVAGKTLQTLGYTLDAAINHQPFSNDEIMHFNELNEALKHHTKTQQPPADAERRLLQEALINNIKKRLSETVFYTDVKKIAV